MPKSRTSPVISGCQRMEYSSCCIASGPYCMDAYAGSWQEKERNEMAEYAEFDGLLSRYFDGAATADEMAQLESRLIADEKFAEHFSRWCLLHRQITEVLTESTLHALMDRFATGSPSLPKTVLSQITSSTQGRSKAGQGGPRPGRLFFRRFLAGISAAAA